MQKYEDDRQFHEIGIISDHCRKIQRGDYMVERLKFIMDGRYGDSFTQEKSTTHCHFRVDGKIIKIENIKVHTHTSGKVYTLSGKKQTNQKPCGTAETQ